MRIAMESFAVRKGERTFNADNNQNIFLASLAQSINTFLAGLMFYFFDFSQAHLLIVFFALSFIISVSGVLIKFSKLSLAFTSLVYLVGGIGLVITSVYLGFF
jgi:putative Mn2+ efflux pump MntP